jgi:flavin-dependent dehydrogenase
VTDVLIAEGGLVGSAVAIQLGRIGISAKVFERGQFPMEKPCSEGLMPAGVAALERLGLNAEKVRLSTESAYHVGEPIAKGRFSEARGLAGNHGAAPFGETGQDNHTSPECTCPVASSLASEPTR